MAKKKTTVKSSKGINLLNGITGSRLAKLVLILVILLAVPITVVSLKQQTNLQQNAAGAPCPDKYGNSYANCVASKGVYNCSTTWSTTGCFSGQSCCTNAGNLVTKCKAAGGTCLDVNSYTCSALFQSGKCPGAINVRCCVGTYKLVSQVPCAQYIDTTTGVSGFCTSISNCTNSTSKGKCSGTDTKGRPLVCCTHY
jgi:hypothetical protein